MYACVVKNISGTFVATHIFLPHASMVSNIQDSYFKFHSVMVHACKLLWSLPTIAPWVELKTWYHDFMMTGALEWDEPGFQLKGFWATISTKLMLKEELE